MAMKNTALRVAVVSALCNVALAALKYPMGLYFGSGALISDAFHSLTDVFCNIIVIFGIYFAAKEPDERHNFGHSRFESLASLLLGVILLAAGFTIGRDGVLSITSGSYAALPAPGTAAFAVAVFSIILKELLYRYIGRVAEKTGSAALMADARHHRTDSVATLGSIVGMGAAALGLPVLDPIASVFICLFIIKTAVELFLGALHELADCACSAAEKKNIMRCCEKNGVRPCFVRTRCSGGVIYCELTLPIGGEERLSQLNKLEKALSEHICATLGKPADIVIRYRSL